LVTIRVDESRTILELLKSALAGGAIGLILHSGRQPEIRFVGRVEMCDVPPATFDDVEAMLRELMSSRQMREFRATGLIYFKSCFEGCALFCAAQTVGEEIHVELRKLSA
jgi:Tfp pilus assembly pilus retraction ATPase PilT